MTTQPGCPDPKCENGVLTHIDKRGDKYVDGPCHNPVHEKQQDPLVKMPIIFAQVGYKPIPHSDNDTHPSHKSESSIPGHGPLMQSVLDELHEDETEPTVNEGPERTELGKQYDKYQEGRRVGFAQGVASCQEKIKAAKEQLLEYAKDRKDEGLFRFIVDVWNNNDL